MPLLFHFWVPYITLSFLGASGHDSSQIPASWRWKMTQWVASANGSPPTVYVALGFKDARPPALTSYDQNRT
jgi:hypothetical protein